MVRKKTEPFVFDHPLVWYSRRSFWPRRSLKISPSCLNGSQSSKKGQLHNKANQMVKSKD